MADLYERVSEEDVLSGKVPVQFVGVHPVVWNDKDQPTAGFYEVDFGSYEAYRLAQAAYGLLINLRPVADELGQAAAESYARVQETLEPFEDLRLTEDGLAPGEGIELKAGDQILYVPDHAKSLSDSAVEIGFVSKVRLDGESAWCHFWYPAPNQNELRTSGGSGELCKAYRLVMKDTHNQGMVDNLIAEFQVAALRRREIG